MNKSSKLFIGIWFSIFVEALNSRTLQEKIDFSRFIRILIRKLNWQEANDYLIRKPLTNYMVEENGGLFKWCFEFYKEVYDPNADEEKLKELYGNPQSNICMDSCTEKSTPEIKITPRYYQ